MPPKTKYIIGLSYSTDTNKELSLLTDKKAVTHDVFFEVLKTSLRSAHAMHKLNMIEVEVNKGIAITNIHSDLEVVKSVEASVEENLEKVIMPTLSKGLTIGNLYFEIKC